MIKAQGQAAEAAVLGKGPRVEPPIFLVGRAKPLAGVANQEKGEGFIVSPQPRAALVLRSLGYYLAVLTGLQRRFCFRQALAAGYSRGEYTEEQAK